MTRKLLLSLLAIGVFFSSKAVHVLGGDIGWDCLGNDSFKVTLTVYRDCNELPLTSINTKVSSTCKEITLSNTISGGTDITPVCGNLVSRCKDTASTYPFGIEVYTLTSIVDLSSQRKNGCCSIILSASVCCRGNSISTGARRQNFYIESTLDLCKSSCTSSPKWKSHPLIINCLGSDVVIDHGVFSDAASGLDSVIIDMTPPLTSNSSPTSWTSSYSYDKPVTFLNFPKKDLPLPRGFHVDKTTGTIRFRPMGKEVSIMAVKASMWKDGKLIGTITRDFHIIVVSCGGNNVPEISGINCASPSVNSINLSSCPGKEICFKICSSDNRDTTDSTTLIYNGGIPGASFKILNPGAQFAQGQFCWTPTKSDVNSVPHTFIVTAKDNACPVPRTNPLLFKITVSEPKPPVLFQDIVPIDSCGKYRMMMRSLIDLDDVYWLMNDTVPIGTGDTIEYTFQGTGLHKITGVYNECPVVKIHDTINVRNSTKIKVTGLSDTTLCANEILQLDPAVSGITGTASFKWTMDTALTVDSTNSKKVNIKFPNKSDTYVIRLNIADGSACGASKEIRVATKEAKTVEVDHGFELCEDDNRSFQLDLFNGLGNWSGSGVNGNTFNANSAGIGIHELSFKLEDEISCIADTAIFDIAAMPQLVIGDDFSWCTDNGPIPLNASPTGGTWVGAGINTSNEFDGKGLAKGIYKLVYTYASTRGCISKDSVVASVYDYAVGSVTAPDSALSCAYGSSFNLVGAPKGGQWSGAGFASSGEELRVDPTLLTSGQYQIVYTYRDMNQCGNSDTTTLIIFETPTANFDVLDTVIAQNDKLPIKNTSYDANGSKYTWKISPPTSKIATGFEPTIIMDQLGMHDISLYTLDTISGCADTLEVTSAVRVVKFVGGLENPLEQVSVYPNPTFHTLFIENPVNADMSIQLLTSMGQLVLYKNTGMGTSSLDLSELPGGTYQLRLVGEHNTRIIGIVKE